MSSILPDSGTLAWSYTRMKVPRLSPRAQGNAALHQMQVRVCLASGKKKCQPVELPGAENKSRRFLAVGSRLWVAVRGGSPSLWLLPEAKHSISRFICYNYYTTRQKQVSHVTVLPLVGFTLILYQ